MDEGILFPVLEFLFIFCHAVACSLLPHNCLRSPPMPERAGCVRAIREPLILQRSRHGKSPIIGGDRGRGRDCRANERHSARHTTNPPSLTAPAIFCRLKSSILTGESVGSRVARMSCEGTRIGEKDAVGDQRRGVQRLLESELFCARPLFLFHQTTPQHFD